jgi:hypothetical protein
MNTLPQVMSMPILEEETTNTITVSWNSSSRSGVQYELWGDGDADGNFIKMENTIDHYRVFNEEMNWLEANEFCASLDAQLVTIPNQSVQDILETKISHLRQ